MTLRMEGPLSVGKLAVLLIALAVTIVGCHKVTGGGWIGGVNGGKATFGFQAQCVEVEDGGYGQFEGQFQYNDRGAGVRFHGDINANIFSYPPPELGLESCSDVVEFTNPDALNEARFQGECTSPGGVKGTFAVVVTDNGTPGSLAGDIITVQTPASAFFGEPCTDNGTPYSNSGVIGGGNIVSHGHKDET